MIAKAEKVSESTISFAKACRPDADPEEWPHNLGASIHLLLIGRTNTIS